MTPLLANVIGITASVLFMGAFVYANRVEKMDKLLFNAVNLAGAVLLLISLSVHFNLAAVVLETAWALIALAGIVKALQERRTGAIER